MYTLQAWIRVKLHKEVDGMEDELVRRETNHYPKQDQTGDKSKIREVDQLSETEFNMRINNKKADHDFTIIF